MLDNCLSFILDIKNMRSNNQHNYNYPQIRNL